MEVILLLMSVSGLSLEHAIVVVYAVPVVVGVAGVTYLKYEEISALQRVYLKRYGHSPGVVFLLKARRIVLKRYRPTLGQLVVERIRLRSGKHTSGGSVAHRRES